MSGSSRYKVVVDTNVLLSGLFFGGKSGKILSFIKNNKIEWLISPETTAELIGKLPRFTVDPVFLMETASFINNFSIRILPLIRFEICRDDRDNMFLDLAYEGKADYIITGDKDLLVLKNFKGSIVVKPAQFVKLIG